MINFSPFLLRKCLNSCGAFSKSDGLGLSSEDLRVIGQQKDGQIIVVGTCIKEPFLEKSTFIACVNIGKNEAQIISKTKGIVDIVYASVSADQRLLAFSVRKDFLPKSLAVQRQEEIFDRWKYQAFLVRLDSNLSSEDKWLPVTICHSYVIHVHFLDSENSTAIGLLVLTHKHSIQLHQIQVQDADIIHVASSQVLGVAFDWAQWLPHQQCLMYMATPSCPEKQPYAMSSIQFCRSSQYSTVFSISASAIGIRDFFVHDNREAPSVASLNKISVASLNLDVVLWKNGTVCICYQSPPSLRNAWKVSSARDGLKYSAPIVRSRHRSLPGLFVDGNRGPVESSVFESTYTITLLHHGCQLQCTHEADCPEKLWPIIFLPIEDQQLLVVASGIPSHLLDIDPSHEPLHHIVHAKPCWPFDCLSEAYAVVIPNEGISVLMEKEKGFSACISTEKLISLFSCNTSSHNRRSIVHYLATHSPSSKEMIQEIFIALQQDVLNIEVTSLLQELLLGSTFAKTKKRLPTCQEILYHLPFTTITAMENEESGLRVTCMYEHLSTDPLLLASSKIESDADNVWHLLWHYQKSFRKRKVVLSMNSELSLQFDLRIVARNLAGLHNLLRDVPPDGNTCTSLTSTKASFCLSDLCTLCSRSNLSNKEAPSDIGEIIQQVTQPFPSDGSDKDHMYLITTTTWGSLHRFLLQSCPAVNKNFVHKIATTYVSEQVCQSNILCNILFSSLGIHPCQEKDPFYFLEEMPPEVIYPLSSLSERYLVAAQGLAFPLPDGFSSACTLLAFHTTDFLIFMQFVQNGSLKLKKDVVLYLLKRMDDSPESIQKKLLLLGHLPKDEGEDVLADSQQIIGSKFYARKKARDLLTVRDITQPSVQQATEHDVETSDLFIDVAEIAIDANRFT